MASFRSDQKDPGQRQGGNRRHNHDGHHCAAGTEVPNRTHHFTHIPTSNGPDFREQTLGTEVPGCSARRYVYSFLPSIHGNRIARLKYKFEGVSLPFKQKHSTLYGIEFGLCQETT
jgi:hypothetical protein